MDTKTQIQVVELMLEHAVIDDNWEAAYRFTFVLSLLRKDLILEQDKLINNLRKVG